MHTNGSSHHHSEAILDRLVAAGLIQDADRGDHVAVDAALKALLDRFVAVPPGRPISNFFCTPQIECASNTHLLLALFEMLIVSGVLPAPAVGALFAHARAQGVAAHQPAGLQAQLNHLAEVLDWALKPHGETIDSSR
jgi:hypothetical protein